MKNRKAVTVIILFLSALVSLIPVVSYAVTASISPSSILYKGQSLTVTATWVPTFKGGCTVFANFDNGGPDHEIPCSQYQPGPEFGTCTGSVTYTYNNPGTYSIRVYASNCPGEIPVSVSLPVRVNCLPIDQTSPTDLPDATAGIPYSYRIGVSGGEQPYNFTQTPGSPLPSWLTLQGQTGVLSGTPQSPGTYPFSLTVTDSCPLARQSVSKKYQIRVGCPTLNITSPPSLPQGAAGVPYYYQMKTSGGTGNLSWQIVSGSIPPGLTMSPAGVISGVPESPGEYSFTARVTDSCPTGPQTRDTILTLTVSLPSLEVQVTPPSLRVPRGVASSQVLSYTGITDAPSNLDLLSTEGLFLAGGQEIGRIDSHLRMSIRNGTGRTSETILFPVTVIKRAERLGLTRVKFRRIFTVSPVATSGVKTMASPVTITAEAEITITTEAGAPLNITRMQLYFDNRRAETTVKRNDPSLRAYVDIRFTGSGLLEGYWEVDGRLLSNVKRHIVYGRTVTFETPKAPPLPTFETGTHILRFVLTSPEGVPVPEAIYFVTAEEFIRTFSISLISPENKAEIEYRPPVFEWESAEGVAAYLLEFYDAREEKPVFSAYTRKEEYVVPARIFGKIFHPGRTYRWQVKSFDETGSVLGVSLLREFTLREPQYVLPDRSPVGSVRSTE